jgi:hypothetical protein
VAWSVLLHGEFSEEFDALPERFYRQLLKKADKRFDDHLAWLKRERE